MQGEPEAENMRSELAAVEKAIAAHYQQKPEGRDVPINGGVVWSEKLRTLYDRRTELIKNGALRPIAADDPLRHLADLPTLDEAAAELFDRLNTIAAKVVAKFSKAKNEFHVDDVSHVIAEVFGAAILGLADNPEAVLTAAVQRELMGQVERRDRNEKVSKRIPAHTHADPADVLALIDELPPIEREIIKRHCLLGLNFPDLARDLASMGVHESTYMLRRHYTAACKTIHERLGLTLAKPKKVKRKGHEDGTAIDSAEGCGGGVGNERTEIAGTHNGRQDSRGEDRPHGAVRSERLANVG